MKGKIKEALFYVALVVAGVLFKSFTRAEATEAPVLPYYQDETWTAAWYAESDPALKEVHTVGDFQFTDQNGRQITQETFEGRIYVANFFFSVCPSVCPKMKNNLMLVQEAFRGDDRVKILSHTVMPWNDSVPVLHSYAERNGINGDQWHLVTGSQDELYKIGRLGYFADEGFGKGVTDLDDFLHTENIVLVDHKRRLRGIYNGTLPLETQRMIEDIHWLLNAYEL